MRPAWCGLKKGRPNPVVCGRRFCARCGRWRLVATEFHLYPNGKFHSICRTCKRIANRRDQQARTEEQRELVREYQRFWQEVRRRAAGIPPRRFNYSSENRRRRVTVVDRRERVLLPRQPILDEIERWLQSNLPEWRRDPERSVENLAALAGLDPRTINRIQNGESQHVSLDVADKLAMALDVPLALIYPDDEERLAA